MENQVSETEKIDYIYTRLKQLESQEKRQRITKWLFRIVIIGYVYYLMMIVLPSMISGMIPDMPNMDGVSIENVKGAVGEYFAK